MPDAGGWVSRSTALGRAFAWRMRREGLRYLLAAFTPLVLVTTLISVLPTLTGGHGINGAANLASFGSSYGAHSNAVTVGLLLMLLPGIVALFSSLAVAKTIRGLVGAEVSRGGLEALLSAPYTPGIIAAAMLGYALLVATAFWACMSAVGVVAIASLTVASGDHLTLNGSYLAMALALPLLAVWAGTALSMFVSLLLPRWTQLGATISVAGGDLGAGLAAVPALLVLLTILFGVRSLGPGTLLLIGGVLALALAVGSVVGVARGFRAETVLDS